MHDLETALAELISVTEGPAMGRPWVPADFVSDTTGEAFATVVATVLNAVLSGDLIPKALLAAANEAAADFVGNEAPSFPDEVAWCVEDLAQAIRAITHADAQAALDAMISRAREVKPLAWLSGWFCDQEAFYADTAVGNWAVVQYSSRNGRWAYDDPSGETSDEDWESASLAQAAVHLEHTARIHAALRANAMDASEGER